MVWGLQVRVEDFGFGVWDLADGRTVWGWSFVLRGFGVWGFGVWSFRFGVWGLEFGIWGLGPRGETNGAGEGASCTPGAGFG